jgi:CRP-like cAMP-binding protein
MKKYLEILKKCPLFNGIDPEGVLRIVSCLNSRRLSFDKKEMILCEGASARNIGIVLSGSVHIVQHDYYGNQTILADAYPSDLFCESFACAGVDSLPVSVMSNEPCEVLLFEGKGVVHTCEKNCEFHRKMIYNLVHDLAGKSIALHQRIKIVSKRTTRDKLMEYLMTKAAECGKSTFEIPYDRQELADYLEVDRSGLSAEIGKLKREGIIENRKRYFKIIT